MSLKNLQNEKIKNEMHLYLEKHADINFDCQKLISITENAAKMIFDKRIEELLAAGLPAEIVKLSKNKTDIFKLSDIEAKSIQGFCISSSNINKFRPGTGNVGREVDVESLIDHMDQLKVEGSS